MKKIIIALVLCVAASASWAQKGSWYIGGVAGYASSSDKAPSGFTQTTNSWAFGPEVGTFLKDDIQLGLFLGLSGESQKDDNGDISSNSTMSPTIYGRKFWSVTENFSVFAGLYLAFISQSQKTYPSPTVTNEQTGSGFGARVGIGVAYALSPRFTAVGQYGLLGFSSVSNKQNGTDAGSSTSFDFGVNTIGYSNFSQGNGSGSVFNIGLYYTFKKSN